MRTSGGGISTLRQARELPMASLPVFVTVTIARQDGLELRCFKVRSDDRAMTSTKLANWIVMAIDENQRLELMS
jgi:hypothetical protein